MPRPTPRPPPVTITTLPERPRSLMSSSDPDQLRDALAVPGRIAQEIFGPLRALQVQMHVVLPGEADSTVDLERIRGALEVGLGAIRLGQRGHPRQLG